MYLDFLHLSRLSQLNYWHCQIDKGIPQGFYWAAFNVFKQLYGLQGSNAACCSREGRSDATSLELNTYPFHFL